MDATSAARVRASGVDQVVNGFAQAYSLDEGYRIAHHGIALMSPENWQMQPLAVKIDTPVGTSPCAGGSATVLEENGLKVTAFTVDHAPVAPAYGYRFDYKGRSVVVRRRYDQVRQSGRSLEER